MRVKPEYRLKPGSRERLKPRQITWARARWRGAMPISDLAIGLGISRRTLQNYAARHEFGPHPSGNDPHRERSRNDPTPKQWRCECCGGRSTSAGGHPQCQRTEAA